MFFFKQNNILLSTLCNYTQKQTFTQQMASTFDSFLSNLQRSGATEATCLISQTIISVAVMRNLRNHWDQFPIKQLSPLCTLTALLSFFFLNLISVVARAIQQANNYYEYNLIADTKDDCAQCRIYHHPELQVLAILYVGLRELPLILFALKTLRVSICFVSYKTLELPKWLRILFGTEKSILLTSLIYSVLVATGNLIELKTGNSLTPTFAELTFQFLCPKQSAITDWIVTLLRYLMLAVSYTLSTLTYRQLDFKRFIFIIFMLSNIQVLLRCIFVFTGLDSLTYHQFYYHSLFLNLCGTIILYPYSNFNKYVRQPPAATVLQSFDAFLNYAPGASILKCFAIYKDKQQNTIKYSKCFDYFIIVRQSKMVATLEPKCIGKLMPQFVEGLESIEVGEVVQGVQMILDKAERGQCSLTDIKRVEKNLFDFCQKYLFKQWKKTESRMYIQQQFKKNMVIDQKMNSLGIEIGY